jgi:NADPH:quinone reductase-like Zn-dependent oxidoreductase
LNIDKTGADAGQSILIINGAGGVGSIAIQLAKLAKLKQFYLEDSLKM